jgi:hypothetical protein
MTPEDYYFWQLEIAYEDQKDLEELDDKPSESYEDSDWFNDPNSVMSRHHY